MTVAKAAEREDGLLAPPSADPNGPPALPTARMLAPEDTTENLGCKVDIGG